MVYEGLRNPSAERDTAEGFSMFSWGNVHFGRPFVIPTQCRLQLLR